MEVLELGDEVVSVPEDALDFGPVHVLQLEWTPDGQILTVASQVSVCVGARACKCATVCAFVFT